MKIKKKSIIIPAFALLIGASLAGSISGTVAWYQYSTRVHAAYVGVSGGDSGNLQIKLGAGEWASRLTIEQIASYLSTNSIGTNVVPATSGDMLKNAALPAKLHGNPVVGRGPYSKWIDADAKSYVTLPIQLRYVERENDVVTAIEKKIYLSELLIQKHVGETNDISDAIRVHIANVTDSKNFLVSNKGETISVGSKLDLDGDGHDDQAYPEDDKYGFKGGELTDVIYGSQGGTQAAYSVSELCVTANDDARQTLSGVSADKVIGTAPADGALQLNITIWVEGWQELDDKVLWDKKYIGADFDVGFEFAVDPDEA